MVFVRFPGPGLNSVRHHGEHHRRAGNLPGGDLEGGRAIDDKQVGPGRVIAFIGAKLGRYIRNGRILKWFNRVSGTMMIG